MSFSCPICSDSLSKAPADPQNHEGSKVSCTPCGHLFHAFCITKWLGGTLATSSQCPCCRVSIPKKKCLPLYPNTLDDSILNDSVNVACDHVPHIESLNFKIRTLENKLEQTEQLKASVKEDFDNAQRLLINERLRNEKITMKYKEMESYKTYSEELKEQLDTAEAHLQSLNYIRSAIESVHGEVELQDEHYPVTSESISTLKSIKEILTKELKVSNNKVKEALQQQERLREENRKAKRQVATLTKDKEDLENNLAIMKIEMNEFKKEASLIDLTSPPANSGKKRKSETAAPHKLFKFDQTVIEVSPDIDKDIPILQPFYKTNHRKHKDLKLGRRPKSADDLITGKETKPTSTDSSSAGTSSRGGNVKAGTSSELAKHFKPKAKVMQSSSADDCFDDLASIGFSANLKSSLPGLVTTPASSYRRKESKSNFGAPKPPKILQIRK